MDDNDNGMMFAGRPGQGSARRSGTDARPAVPLPPMPQPHVPVPPVPPPAAVRPVPPPPAAPLPVASESANEPLPVKSKPAKLKPVPSRPSSSVRPSGVTRTDVMDGTDGTLNSVELMIRRIGRSWFGTAVLFVQAVVYGIIPATALVVVLVVLFGPFPVMNSVAEGIAQWTMKPALMLVGQYHGEVTADDILDAYRGHGIWAPLMTYLILWMYVAVLMLAVLVAKHVWDGSGAKAGFAQWFRALTALPRGWNSLMSKIFGNLFRHQFKAASVIVPIVIVLALIYVLIPPPPKTLHWGNQYGSGVSVLGGPEKVLLDNLVALVIIMMMLVLMFAVVVSWTVAMLPFVIFFFYLFYQGGGADASPLLWLSAMITMSALFMWFPELLRYYASDGVTHLGREAFATFPLVTPEVFRKRPAVKTKLALPTWQPPERPSKQLSIPSSVPSVYARYARNKR